MDRTLNYPKAIFWDMDGTLVDSEPIWGIATNELSEMVGKRLTPELRETTVGGSFDNTMAVIATYAGVTVTEEQKATYKRWMYDKMAVLLAKTLEPRPGVAELLMEISSLSTSAKEPVSVPMFVTTNTDRELADPSIAAIGPQFFADTIAGDEVENAKPAPEMYLEAARRAGADPSDCLVFEDSAAGMAAAAAAGCRLIGLPASDDQAVPAGAAKLVDLHGSTSFEGVTSGDVFEWFRTAF